MANRLTSNLQLNAPLALDNRSGVLENGVWRPFNSLAEFELTIPIQLRPETLIFFVRNENSGKPDLYVLDSNKEAFLLLAEVDLSNYYNKGQIDGFISTITNSLSNEILNRENCDLNNYNLILVEAQRAKSVENDLQNRIDTLESGILNVNPTDAPTSGIYTYNANSSGIYINFGGLNVSTSDLESGLVQLRLTNGSWVKVITPIDLGFYITESDLRNEADNIFDKFTIDKFTPTFPVRRYTSATDITNYSAGYSQTATLDGLNVQIPSVANQGISYFVNTGISIPNKKLRVNFYLNNIDVVTSTSFRGLGVGYINNIGEYVMYIVTKNGLFRKFTNFSGETIHEITGLTLLNGDMLSYEIDRGKLSVFVNDVFKYSISYNTDEEFNGNMLFGERGNVYYTVYSELFDTPVTDYIKNSINESDEKLIEEIEGNFVTQDSLVEQSSNLFKSETFNFFPDHNLPVRRYTSSTAFNDYTAGYSQTASPDGLLVQIPNSGTSAITHFVNTLKTVPNSDEFRIKLEVTSLLTTASIGIGYINNDGDYIGLMFSSSGDFRRIRNYSITFQSPIISPFTGPTTLDFIISNGMLTIEKDGASVYIYNLETEGFFGNVLIGQKGFLYYKLSTNSVIDPIRNYVSNVASNSYPNCFYSYNPIGTPNGQSGQPPNGMFYIYVRIDNTNKYVRYELGHEVDMREAVYKNYWRIIRASWFKYDGLNMTPLDLKAITDGESECVYKRNSDKDDFTGGVHGDELFTSVRFFAGGVSVEVGSDNIPLTPCTSFSYLESSTMHATSESGVIITGHPLECYHWKHTTFDNSGYTTFNRLTWVMPGLVTLWYHGICCYAKDQATIAYSESTFLDAEMNGDNQEKLTSTGFREVYYRNNTNKLGGFITSKLISPNKDNTSILFVQDRGADSKYYRRVPATTVANGDVWESVMTVKHTTLD